jgi:hypothetical protein
VINRIFFTTDPPGTQEKDAFSKKSEDADFQEPPGLTSKNMLSVPPKAEIKVFPVSSGNGEKY